MADKVQCEAELTIPASMVNDPRYKRIIEGAKSRINNLELSLTLEEEPAIYFFKSKQLFRGFHTLYAWFARYGLAVESVH